MNDNIYFEGLRDGRQEAIDKLRPLLRAGIDPGSGKAMTPNDWFNAVEIIVAELQRKVSAP